MLVSKATLQDFMKAKIDSFPYEDIKVTRNHFHPKWILLTERAKTPGAGNPISQPMSATVLEQDTLDYLIVSEEAIPLPDSICAVLDYMDVFGKKKYYQWYQEVVEAIADLIRKRCALPQWHLYLTFIHLLVDHLLDSIDSIPVHVNEHISYTWKDEIVVDEWTKECTGKTFSELVEDAENYVRRSVLEYLEC